MQLSPFFISLVISLSAYSVAAAPNAVINSEVLKREVETAADTDSANHWWGVGKREGEDTDTANHWWGVGKREGEDTDTANHWWGVGKREGEDTDSANHWWGVGKREPIEAPAIAM